MTAEPSDLFRLPDSGFDLDLLLEAGVAALDFLEAAEVLAPEVARLDDFASAIATLSAAAEPEALAVLDGFAATIATAVRTDSRMPEDPLFWREVVRVVAGFLVFRKFGDRS